MFDVTFAAVIAIQVYYRSTILAINFSWLESVEEKEL